MSRRPKLWPAVPFFLFLSSLACPVCLAGPAAPPVDLLRGAIWQYSTDGKTFSDQPPVVQPGKRLSFIAKLNFDVGDTAGVVCLEFAHELPASCRCRIVLNGQMLKGPMKRMSYHTIPAIDPGVLKSGTNSLAVRGMITSSAGAKPLTLAVGASLKALRPEHLAIQTGPILGAFGEDFFTITCRTNMPATVSVRCARGSLKNAKEWTVVAPRVGGRSHRNAPKLVHRIKAKVDGPGLYEYEVVASRGETGRSTAKGRANLPDPAGALRLVVMGDSRTNPDSWAKVAKAVLKQDPDLIVFGGDMVVNGRYDWQWDDEYFGPARELFARIPTYAVIGNHEGRAPLYYEVFWTPSEDGRSPNWSQQIGQVLLIGIDGAQDWSAGGKNVEWLDRTLAGAKAKFIFLVSHYPAWTSSIHGTLDEQGNPREKPVRQGREVVLPLLAKYKATAMFAGHDHIYERSEPPGGVTHIISGGAGAPLRKKSDDAARQNPYSKVFASKLHYCLLEVAADACTMKAITPEGEIIDRRTWPGRGAR